MDITIISTGKHGSGIATRILAGGNREKHRGRLRRPGDRRPRPGARVVKAFNTTFAGTLARAGCCVIAVRT